MNLEAATMQLIVNSGNARSRAMEAIGCAKAGDFEKATDKLTEADAFLTKAHEFQTDFIQEEAEGGIEKVTILMAHAQDHLMNAITIADIAREFVELYQTIHQKKEKE